MKVVIVTEPVRAYGLELVSELCREGYFVIAITKSATDAELVSKTVTHRYDFAQIETIVGNFNSIASLRQIVLNIKLLATQYRFNSIYAVICNQEKVYDEFQLNEDGIERIFFENYLTNIFLCESLIEYLQKEPSSKIICPTLPQNQLVGINLKDLYRQNSFTPQSAMRQAKFANALMVGYFNVLYNQGSNKVTGLLYHSKDVSSDEELVKEKEQGRLARLLNKPTEFESIMQTIIALVNLKNYTSICYKDSKPVQAPSIVSNKEMGEKFWLVSEKISRLKYFSW